MRITLVVNAFPKASETFIYAHARGLLEHGHRVHILAHTRSTDGPLFAPLAGLSVEQIPAFGHEKGRFLSYFLRHLGTFGRAFWQTQNHSGGIVQRLKLAFALTPFLRNPCDILHFEFSGLAVQYADILPFISAKKVLSCRGSAEKIRPLVDPERGVQLKALGPKIDLFHCVTADMGRTMLEFGIPSEKIRVNYPSIDPQKFKPKAIPKPENSESRPIQILSVGRMHWVKGYPEALLAIQNVAKVGFSVQYSIIGQSEWPEQLAFMVQALGLQHQVQLLGPKDSAGIVAALEQTDIFLLPSHSEGLSNAALEAMAMELPVVSTRAGGMSEAIESGENGFLVDLFSPTQMSERLIFLIQNPEERRRLGQNARKTVLEKFTLARQSQVFLEMYETLFP